MIHSVLFYEKDFNHKDKFVQTAYSEKHIPLMTKSRKGEVPLYLRSSEGIKAKNGRKPAYAISGSKRKPEDKSGHISGVYTPDLEKSHMGYGNYDEDALLILNKGKEIIIIILLGKRLHDLDCWQLWVDNDPELLEEIEDHLSRLRKPD